MMMARRVQRLERQHHGTAVDVAQRDRERAIGNISLLLRFDPEPAGDFADLLNNAIRLEAAGEFLTPEECEEGRRLGERLTESLREAQIASGQKPDGGQFAFPYVPGMAVAERVPVAAGDHE